MDYYDQIEDYLNGRLAPTERSAFEAEMEEDDSLRQAAADHEVAMDVVGSILEGEVRKVIAEEGQHVKVAGLNPKEDNDKTKRTGRVKRMHWMGWASVAAVVFVLGWWGVREINQTSESILFSDLKSEPAWPIERSSDEDSLSLLITEYFDGFAKEVKAEIKKKKNWQARYWLSELYFKEEKLDSTLLYLPESNLNSGIKRRDRINYLRILSLYFIGKRSEAKQEVAQLPVDTDSYYTKIYSKLVF